MSGGGDIRLLQRRLAAAEDRIAALEAFVDQLAERLDRQNTGQIIFLRTLHPRASWWTDLNFIRDHLLEQFWISLTALAVRVRNFLEGGNKAAPPVLDVEAWRCLALAALAVTFFRHPIFRSFVCSPLLERCR